MAASISTSKDNGCSIQRGEISDKNIATPTLRGNEINKASKEENNVPNI